MCPSVRVWRQTHQLLPTCSMRQNAKHVAHSNSCSSAGLRMRTASTVPLHLHGASNALYFHNVFCSSWWVLVQSSCMIRFRVWFWCDHLSFLGHCAEVPRKRKTFLARLRQHSQELEREQPKVLRCCLTRLVLLELHASKLHFKRCVFFLSLSLSQRADFPENASEAV